jgi:hypothetical protein
VTVLEEQVGAFIARQLTLLVFLLFMLYALFCIILGQKKAGQAVSYLVVGGVKAAVRFIARILKIAVMFVVNLAAMSIRMFCRPDQIQDAWATFIERMADVIFGA